MSAGVYAGTVQPERAQAVARREFNSATHALRGLASFAVFWAHLLGGTAEHIYASNSEYVSLINAPWCLGRWGVVLFFAISGFVILPSVRRYTLGEFALRRALRLYPLFLALSLLFVVLNALSNEYPHTNNLTAVVSGLLFLNLFTHTDQLTPNAWSLTYEVMFYILAAGGFYLSVRKKSRVGAVVSIIFCFLFMFRYPISMFFFGGVLIRLAYDADLKLSQKWRRYCEVGFGLACVLLAGTFHFDFSQSDMTSSFAWALMVATLLYFYFAVEPNSLTTAAAKSRVLVYLGTVSYSLYLVHPYTYYLTRTVFDRLDLFTDDWVSSILLFFAVTTPFTLAITHLAHKALEIGPYQWFFNQRIYGKGKLE